MGRVARASAPCRPGKRPPVAGKARPIQRIAVAIVRHDDTDCPQLDYTLQGTLYELPDGAELVWASKPLTGEDGQGQSGVVPEMAGQPEPG